MHEEQTGRRGACQLRCGDEVAFAQGERFRPHEAGYAHPRGQADDHHDIGEAGLKEGYDRKDKEEVVDVARLYRITELTTDHEPIHLILSDYGYDGLPCLDVPTKTKEYNCFLSIIPGGLLADLYKEYSGQLLESNIRAFLGSKNKYNKGIKETICRKPHMFLPYNNGISATAKSVVLRNINGVKCIAEIDDLQIVNGGQTTASMYFTRKEHKCSLDEVFVQMKLTIILNEDRRGEIVPDIAKYANSQSKVTDLDLESNNEKFLAIEHLSRRMYVCKPGENPNDKCVLWYFERTNGQFKTYLNKLGRSSDAAVKKFKAQNPHKFVKSDIAKYIKIWQRLPHIVVLGSQKCFNKYKDELKKKDFQIGEKYYKKIIANAILFREADSLYGRGDKAKGDGSIKSVIVAYTLAYFHVLTDNRLDLWDIYDKQIVPKLVLSAISDLMDFVLYKFATLPNKKEGQMYTELGKKEETWKYFQTIEYDVDLLQKLEIHLVSKEERDYRDIEDEVVDIDIEAKYLLISDIEKNAKLWTGLLEWGKIVGDYEEEKYRKLLNKIVERLKVNGEFKTEELKLGKIILDYLKDNSSKRKAIKADGDNIIIQMDSYEMYQRVRDVNDIELVTNLENAQNVYKITKQEGQQLLSGVKQIKNGYYMQRILLKDLYNKLEKIGCKL